LASGRSDDTSIADHGPPAAALGMVKKANPMHKVSRTPHRGRNRPERE
jgi:hypothetical protein